jgi:hypothetical protein
MPAAWGGDVAVIDELEFTVKDAAAVDPKFTAVAPVKLLPVMVTTVPPVDGPVAGLIPVTRVGGGPIGGAETNCSKFFRKGISLIDEPVGAVAMKFTSYTTTSAPPRAFASVPRLK